MLVKKLNKLYEAGDGARLEDCEGRGMFRSLVENIPGARGLAAYIRKKHRPAIEDIVRRTFGKRTVRFVQVGSNDGLHNDPIFAMSSTNALWTGMLIEPVPYLFERLKVNYCNSKRFIYENIAIGRKAGIIPFYYVSERARDEIGGLPEWHDQLGSFDKNHILKHTIALIEPFIEVMDVEVCTLEEVLARHTWHNIDLLHIDAEGYDWEILSGVDLLALNPKMVIIEHTHLSVENRTFARQKMTDAHYRVREIGGDFCAIRAGFFGRIWLTL